MLNRRFAVLLVGFFTAFFLAQIVPTVATSSVPTLIALTSSVPPSTAFSLEIATPSFTAGLERYNAEEYEAAIAIWQSTLSQHQQSGDTLDQALVLTHVALAQQHLGQWDPAQQTLDGALALLPAASRTSAAAWDIYGKTLMAQANLHWEQGNARDALTHWRQANEAYSYSNNVRGLLKSRINQARGLSALGLIKQAAEILESANESLEEQPPGALSPALRAVVLRRLGEAYRRLGQLDASHSKLQESLALAPPTGRSAVLLELGNTARAFAAQSQTFGRGGAAATQVEAAWDYYQQAADAAPSELEQAQSRVNLLSLAAEEDSRQVWELWSMLKPQLAELPTSRAAVRVQLHAAHALMSLPTQGLDDSIARLLDRTLQQAREVSDPRLEAQALGQLSNFAARAERPQEAKDLARKTISLADTAGAIDVRYRWEWELGRLLRADWEAGGKQSQAVRTGAIAAYGAAYESLATVRNDLAGIDDAEVAFSFEGNISPLYREFTDLLLSPNAGEEVPAEDLERAAEVLDSLQQVELENFLRCNLAQTLQISEAALDPTAAIVYPIALRDRLEVIVILPNEENEDESEDENNRLFHYTEGTSRSEIESLVADIRLRTDGTARSIDIETLPSIERPQQLEYLLERSQQLYDLLIRPALGELSTAKIQTLVFVLDNTLRDMPVALLHDGEHYLIEQFALAVAPGLQLVQPSPLREIDPAVLAFGLSKTQDDFEPHRGFSDLQFVEQELQEIEGSTRRSRRFLNNDFTADALAEQVQRLTFPVVHLATHGQFSSDPEETFILTWDGKVTVDQIADVFRRREESRPDPVELLVLSACETAVGDPRAALGMAGIAVQSGARSTIASLWQVDDEATSQLMTQLYQRLNDDTLTRAEALRQAQLSLLQDEDNRKYEDPVFWAPFVLVGNWL